MQNDNFQDGPEHRGDASEHHGDASEHHGDGTEHHGDASEHHGDGTGRPDIAEAPTSRTAGQPAPEMAGTVLLHPVAAALLLVMVTFVAYQVLGGVLTYLLFGIDTAEHVVGVRVVTVISQLLFLLIPAVLFLRVQEWDLREALRLRMPRLQPLLVVVVSVVALQFVVQAWVELQQHVMREYLLPEFLIPVLDLFEEMLEQLYGQLLAMHTPAEALAVWGVVAITPALCEEVLFRGAVQYSFEKKMRMRWAFLFSGAIFSFFHLNPVTFIPLAMLGVYFSVITWRGDSLGYAVAAHATNNTIAVVAMYFFQSENLLPVDAAAGAPSLGMYVASGSIGLTVFAVCVWYFWTLTAPREAEPQP